jgi:hypothetical protein
VATGGVRTVVGAVAPELASGDGDAAGWQDAGIGTGKKRGAGAVETAGLFASAGSRWPEIFRAGTGLAGVATA